MSLNIKDPEAHRLGGGDRRRNRPKHDPGGDRSPSGAPQPLQKRKKKASFEELIALAKKVSEGVKRPYPDHGDLLYDEYGLPK